MRKYVASGRNGYYAVDQYRPDESSGTYGTALIYRTRKDAERTAAALNEAYAAGQADGQDVPVGACCAEHAAQDHEDRFR